MRRRGLPPLVNARSFVLILGTFPGPESLKAREYYAHRGNRFWPVLSAVLEFELAHRYESNAASLLSEGVAVWDVLASCERVGALDSSIVDGTEKPNNFNRFFSQFLQIRFVFFNGKKAARLYRRLVVPSRRSPDPVHYAGLPSTSAVNARYSLPRLTRSWAVIRRPDA